MRVIDDETYAALIQLLAQDTKVAIYHKLLLAKKAEPADNKPDEITTESEGEK